ncbi:helix-turn-helix domain-containing protein [Streptomyces albidoflavus]|uniref:helix-turn-helix domain-containing protein n=1 Tax=Streptomyces albidoflavus TaxID=1886 RepID=UPI0033E03F19
MRELSSRLKLLGRPILPSGITKIEQGQRRVDVDDLVALAIALKVTPNRLLFGKPPVDPEAYPSEDSDYEGLYEVAADGIFLRLAPELALDAWATWEWAVGDEPLGSAWKISAGEGYGLGLDERTRFHSENRPSMTSRPGAREYHEALTRLARIMVDMGIDPDAAREDLDRSVEYERGFADKLALARERIERTVAKRRQDVGDSEA